MLFSFQGSGGLGIQVLDSNDDGLETELMVDYGWSPTSVGGDMEADSVFTVLPGIGMLVNFHPSLSNGKFLELIFFST